MDGEEGVGRSNSEAHLEGLAVGVQAALLDHACIASMAIYDTCVLTLKNTK